MNFLFNQQKLRIEQNSKTADINILTTNNSTFHDNNLNMKFTHKPISRMTINPMTNPMTTNPMTNPMTNPIVNPTLTLISSPHSNSKDPPKKILVLYVYHVYNNRVKRFIQKSIFYDDNVDFIIISNTNNKNSNNVINIVNKNVKILFRENVGYDFGGWSDALLEDNLYEKYDNYIFVNSSVVGPFLKPDFKGKWTDLYINGLKDNVKLFGSTIDTCGDPSKFAYVQSYIFSMDKITLKYLIDCSIFSMTNYAKTFKNAINDKEILMSRKIIEKNWNIGSLMKHYKNIDFTFRNKKQNDYNITFLDDVMYPKYRNIMWNEYEVVFIKGNR